MTATGLAYEADPRHVELLARALGLEESRSVSTPGVKDNNVDQDATLIHESEAQEDEDNICNDFEAPVLKPEHVCVALCSPPAWTRLACDTCNETSQRRQTKQLATFSGK